MVSFDGRARSTLIGHGWEREIETEHSDADARCDVKDEGSAEEKVV